MFPLYQRSYRSATAGQAALVLCLLLVRPLGAAEDGSIDRLLKKLPAPEKIVQPRDPAENDPLAKKTFDAINAKKYEQALGYSRKLSNAHRESAAAHGLHGWIAFNLKHVDEATSEFQNAIKIQPNYAFAYFELGLCEAAYGRYANALRDFQQLARLDPKAEVAWIASSECAERLGRKRDCLDYARRATNLAPKSVPAWAQLARAENLNGDKSGAQRAWSRAKQLGQSSNQSGAGQRSTSSKGSSR